MQYKCPYCDGCEYFPIRTRTGVMRCLITRRQFNLQALTEHRYAKTTASQRKIMQDIYKNGGPIREAALAAGVSYRTAWRYKKIMRRAIASK